MSDKLFAFQLAKPLDVDSDEFASGHYDHQSQLLVWQGSNRAQSTAYCCRASDWGMGDQYCNAYGDYCNAWTDPNYDPGPFGFIGYLCD
jgi:hypothetical protein